MKALDTYYSLIPVFSLGAFVLLLFVVLPGWIWMRTRTRSPRSKHVAKESK